MDRKIIAEAINNKVEWSQIVGTNGAKEPFLMEVLSNYSALMYLEKKFGKDRVKSILFSLHEIPYLEYLQKGEEDLPVLDSLKSFNLASYEAIVRGKGTIVLSMLRYLVGDEAFSKILQAFIFWIILDVLVSILSYLFII